MFPKYSEDTVDERYLARLLVKNMWFAITLGIVSIGCFLIVINLFHSFPRESMWSCRWRPYYFQLLLPAGACAICGAACVEEIRRWFRWWKEAAKGIKSAARPMQVRFERKGQEFFVTCKDPAFPNRNFSCQPIFPETYRSQKVNEPMEALAYVRDDWNTPVVLKTAQGTVLIKPEPYSLEIPKTVHYCLYKNLGLSKLFRNKMSR